MQTCTVFATTAQNCYGYNSNSGTGTGLRAATAQNCYGYSTGIGISICGLDADVVIGCCGFSGSGTGLKAYIANSCRVTGGTTNITFKYNMP